MTLEIGRELRDEAAEFHVFLSTLDEKDWSTPTRFMEWTPWDVVAHLHFFDLVSLSALEGHDAFKERQKTLIEGIAAKLSLSETTRRALGHYDFPSLLARWKETCDDMAGQLAESDPKRRLPWFGPDMGVQMFTTARLMETWAHSQAIYDMKKVERVPHDRIRNIVAIGIRTFGWTFVNRKLEVPGPPPYVRLVAPSGGIWEYNDPSETERIEGDAVDFCMTVTQVRNVADTRLRVVGEVANQWMSIAQCFAGGAVDPPKPGYRIGG
jgi:uncharacterized protein (TIGR03084 family)